MASSQVSTTEDGAGSSLSQPVVAPYQVRPYKEELEVASTDMRFARSRLDTLLGSIRKGDIPPNTGVRPATSSHDDDTEKRGPGRPRKIIRERRVIFELRGKPFGMRDGDGIESVYSLCRLWLKNKDEDDKSTRDRERKEREEKDEEARAAIYDDSLDLLATKEIHALPRPRSPVRKQMWPQRSARMDEVINLDEDPVLVRDAYINHWRNVKKSWCDHQKEVDQRFYRSINLLETVYGIAQQNSL